MFKLSEVNHFEEVIYIYKKNIYNVELKFKLSINSIILKASYGESCIFIRFSVWSQNKIRTIVFVAEVSLS